jgi:hypothetical protein
LSAGAGFSSLLKLAQFHSADFAANGLWQVVDELDLPRILVGSRNALDVLLKFMRERVARLDAGFASYECLGLIMAIAFWGMVARVLETTEVELEDFAGKINLLERPSR